MAAMSEPILKVSNIETYYGPIAAIRGVSFDVPQGAIVTILGANGAGKSTVLKTIFGLMDPQKGSVVFEGRQIQGMDPDKVMRLGMSLVSAVSDRVMALNYGRPIATGTPAEVQAHPEVVRAYLGG